MSSGATGPSREQMLAYLLGELPAQELARIDQQLLTDDEFAGAMEEARHDLLDAYALGTLPGGQRERARRALNVSAGDFPVVFARALRTGLKKTAADRAARAEPAQNELIAAGTRAPGWRRPLRWALPLVACVIVAFGGWWLWPGHGPGGTAGPDGAFVLLLRPQVLRGASAARVVSLPAGQSALEVQAVVRGSAKRYAVRVQDASGGWIYADLAARETGGVRFIQFAIPPSRVHSGEYRFEVFGAGDRRRPLWRYRVRLQAH